MEADSGIWRQAFRLAYFIHCDLRMALCVVIHGMEVATLKAKQQEERTGANLMKMNDCQLFQIGLLQASEFYERRQELDQFGNGGQSQPVEWKKSLLEQLIDLAFLTEGLAVRTHNLPLADEDLIIRYIKHLVQVTVTRNSYQVMIGVSQFLYRHGVKEMEHIHLLIDPDLKRGGLSGKSYKTSRKRIWNEMISRFGALLALRGKGRFQVQERTLPLFALVNDCLDHLALWSTEHYLFTDEPHQAHALIHPACYERIIKQLQIKDPTANLAIPRFVLPTNNNHHQRPNRRQPPELTEQQLQLLQEICGKLSKRRKESEPILLSVRVDGVERARFDPIESKIVACRMNAGSRMIEVCSREADGDLLLAVCWLAEFEDTKNQRVLAETRTEAGQVIRFAIVMDETGSATGEITYRETKFSRWLSLEWRRLISHLRKFSDLPIPAIAWTLAGMVVMAMTLFFWLRPKQDELPQVVHLPSPIVESSTAVAPEDSPTPTVPRVQPPLLAENRRTPGSGEAFSEGNHLRRSAGVPLGSVTRIHIQSLGEDELNQKLREALADRLRQTAITVEERILPTTDAVLQRKLETSKQKIMLRLVNRQGKVLWIASFNQNSTEQIADQAIKGLVEAIEREKKKTPR